MSGSEYAVRFVAAAAQIDAALWEACFPAPLEGRWWYEALERAGLEDQFAFFYGVIERDGDAVGIAPAFLMNFPLALVAPPGVVPAVRWLGRMAPSLAFPRTLFLGSPCADEGSVGLVYGVDRRRALHAVQRAFAARAREDRAALLVWKDFPESDRADLTWIAQHERLFQVESYPGTVAAIPSSSREAYFSTMKGSRRHVLKKKIRTSKAAVALDVTILQAPDAPTLDELFALFWQTYEKATTRFEKLNRAFFSHLAAAPATRFIVLRENTAGRAVAFMLCFDFGAHLINKFIGIDYTRPKEWRLYFRLWDAAVDYAVSRGSTSIQSGQTGYAPKIETGHALVRLTNYCAHRNPLVNGVARKIARGIGWRTLDDDLARFLAAHPEADPKGQPPG